MMRHSTCRGNLAQVTARRRDSSHGHMLFLITASKRLPLRPGRNVLGGHDSHAPTGHASSFAVIEVGDDGTAWISTTRTDVAVTVNGAPLGTERMALVHGARIEIAGRRIVFADERAAGTPIPASDTGAALFSADGTRHPILATGLDIGRDPNCDVVIASDDVSRWHAYIAPGPGGCQLKDASTNGVYVNGQRVLGERWLRTGDKIRVGAAQFRFDGGGATSKDNVTTLDTNQMKASMNGPSRPRAETPRSDETVRLSRSGEPATPEPPLLATLELATDGELKGKRFRITRPLVHVGRSRNNDIVIPDRSVSSAHARLQRHGNDWHVTDGDSKNGTYVDGNRVTGERKLPAACEIRFGGVTAMFRAVEGGQKRDPSTQGVVGIMDAQIDKKRR